MVRFLLALLALRVQRLSLLRIGEGRLELLDRFRNPAFFLRFIGDSDLDTLKRFDLSVGTRQFATPDGQRLYPWQGDEGFSAMLDALFRPVLENDLRKEVGRFPCAALVSSCSMVRSGAGEPSVATSENISVIEERINSSLETDLQQALGRHYFYDIRFRVGRVTLPAGCRV